MSLSGNLEDVPLADVLQFIHLGQRTGTLSLSCDSKGAEISFHLGQVIGASSTASKRLGDFLIEDEVIDRAVLDEALKHQRTERPRKNLGQLLVACGAISEDDLRRAIKRQIEETVYELVTWTRGTFQFEMNELRPVDDIGIDPGDIIPHIDLNTQMVLLEATRIFDERNRALALAEEAGVGHTTLKAADAAWSPAEIDTAAESVDVDEETGTATTTAEEDEDEETLASLVDRAAYPRRQAAPPVEHQRFQVISSDEAFCSALEQEIPEEVAHFVRVRIHEAGTRFPGECSPILLLDLRQGEVTPSEIASLRISRPRSPIIAVVDSPELTAKVFEAGALAAVPPQPPAVVACLQSIIRNRRALVDGGMEGSGDIKAGYARLRRILADLRSGLLSATVALNLLHVISESVDRAILFLARHDCLMAMGAFGSSMSGKPLAQMTKGLRLPLNGQDALVRSLDDGQVRSLVFKQAQLSEEFVQLVGAPLTGQVVVFPVPGVQRVIAVIYADNGFANRPIEDLEILELATSHVGMAFENELLRRRGAAS